MTPHAYTELALVEAATMEVLASLDWPTVSAADETFNPDGTLGRESARETALLPRLRAALAKLNQGVPAAALQLAVDELLRDRLAMGAAAANREVHALLTEGVQVSVMNPETREQELRTIRLVDWEHPEQNDFLAVEQLSLEGPLYTCIPDVVLFVNGLPWVVIELKKPGVPVRQAFDENLTSYKHPQNGVPQLFAYNALLVASNGTDAKVGSLTADWDRFFEWKRIEREDEPRRVSLEVLLRGTCEKGRLLDLVRSFSLFSAHKTGLVKVLAQNHQYLGVNSAIRQALAAREAGHGRAGVFWQTQGSGKSFSMVFFAQKILRTVPGNWTFVVVTDRVELDDQIAKTFAACGAVADATACHASSGAHLRQLLGENHRYVFTLLHKFQTAEVLNDRRDVIVIADEAHRSQYDQLAMNMRAALPNALFVAFTGTPLIAGEERTREVFGDYVSIYDFQQSIEDGATVPLFYENRTPELHLRNPDLNDELYEVIDEAGLDDESEARLARLLGQRYHLITRDDRLDAVARDIVQHFLGRGFQGKAMVVSIDKATALRTYDKVRRAWEAEKARVRAAIDYGKPGEELDGLGERLRRLDTVDMAVVVSPGQNEIEEMRQLGLDIVPHRRRMVDSQPPLDEKFKDPDDPLSLVFVCAMWLTGFDAPSCSTIYLDKPMRNHTLMQTIARANRVYPGKQSGLIVDYANVFQSLEKALAIYGAARGVRTPVREKDELVGELRAAVADIEAFCAAAGVQLPAIEASTNALERLTRVGEASNALLASDERRKAFLAHARLAERLYAAIKPHRSAAEFAVRMSTVTALAERIRAETTPEQADLTSVLARIGDVLDRSIQAPAEVRDRPGPPPIDLSRIDFNALAARFQASETKNLDLERLKAAIRAQLDKLIAANETRVDLRERFEALIEEYNVGSKQIEQLFHDLLALSQTLTDEQSRHVREQLTEEELVVFDLLTRPGPELTTDERSEVKKVARQLLHRIRGILTVDWRLTAQARARVRSAIEEALDEGLPRAYTPEVFKTKAGAVFQHVYEHASAA
ncbi:type I restriction endonuclease subunit R [Anaeromyxobacter diazotrophicus]|uniref:Type I restriction enzyme endonuclease subunit n=1 Tax=Anaeromyxobacter diazotrophicus TaxID=2590199 RepID=A0A7I9VIU0_9BACT|nr:type I restriction endonuclease subunit R [Anaeromyxobacter diazotrophicus]GEJ55947.1 DEAD/DEAH box helicase [Anaeromyxobacter diazotrophicus]